jgi:hypothetical protein
MESLSYIKNETSTLHQKHPHGVQDKLHFLIWPKFDYYSVNRTFIIYSF